LNAAKTLGKEDAKIQTSKSTFITKTSASPSAENAGAPSQKRTLNGKNGITNRKISYAGLEATTSSSSFDLRLFNRSISSVLFLTASATNSVTLL
jgi:hypothetical protein